MFYNWNKFTVVFCVTIDFAECKLRILDPLPPPPDYCAIKSGHVKILAGSLPSHCKCDLKRQCALGVSPNWSIDLCIFCHISPVPPPPSPNLVFNFSLKDKTMTNFLPIGGRNPIGLRKTWVSIQEARHRVGEEEQIMTCCFTLRGSKLGVSLLFWVSSMVHGND